MRSAFNPADINELKEKINSLQSDAKPLWGTMSPAKMLAHCNVTYELVYSPPAKKPNLIMRVILKLFVKRIIVGSKPYGKSLKTAPYFIIEDEKEFQNEKSRMLDYLDKTLSLGASHFEGKESYSFGKLSANEWSIMFIKHLEHHLSQFGI